MQPFLRPRVYPQPTERPQFPLPPRLVRFAVGMAGTVGSFLAVQPVLGVGEALECGRHRQPGCLLSPQGLIVLAEGGGPLRGRPEVDGDDAAGGFAGHRCNRAESRSKALDDRIHVLPLPGQQVL